MEYSGMATADGMPIDPQSIYEDYNRAYDVDMNMWDTGYIP